MSKNNPVTAAPSYTDLSVVNLSIQEFARHFEVTPRTIRFYEDKGLLNPNRAAGARVFGLGDLARFEQIMRAKRLGFSLDNIKIVLDVMDGAVSDAVELSRHKHNFEKIVRSLRRQRKDIDTLSGELNDLCVQIGKRLEDMPRAANVTEMAEAYHSALTRHLDDAPDADAKL